MSERRRLPKASPRDDSDLNPRREPALDFPDRPFGELSAADYDAIGFLCGLEVHQQLATRRKLFCRCPAGERSTRVDLTVRRHMRPTLSELGSYDACALMEFKTRKEIFYQVDRTKVCTYELDDTPPFPIDPEAVAIAIEVSLMFELNLVSELHVMRKQYLDGSIPTGFQRTALTGQAGRLPFRVPELGVDRDVRIRQISLEEDSCREISDLGHRVVFRTDRLGTPLTETVTEPDFLNPLEVEAGARQIALITRATDRVRRGPGAARQDVNVSIAGGRRVELKGVPYHRGLPLLVHNEAFRQLSLLRIKAELERRGVTEDLLALPEDRPPWEESDRVAPVESILALGDDQRLARAIGRGHRVAALRLPGFAELLGRATQSGLTFADELRDRVRVIACPGPSGFVVDLDDPAAHGVGAGQVGELRHALKATSEDGVMLVIAPEEDLETAVREVFDRAREALEGVPSETRQALPGGRSGFERLLPGPERMYPDTDTPPLAIDDPLVHSIQSALKPSPTEAAERHERLGLTPAAAWRLVQSPWHELFGALAPDESSTARRLAAALEKRLPELWRLTETTTLPDPARIEPLIKAVDTKQITASALEPLLRRLLHEQDIAPEELVRSHAARGDEEELLPALASRTVAAAKADLVTREPEAALRWAMGRVMPELLGRLDPSRVKEVVAAAMKELVP